MSAIIIQAKARAMLGRLRYADMILSSVMFQAAVRRWRARSAFVKKRKATV